MGISRRQFLGWIGAASAGATAANRAEAASNKQFGGYPDSFGILHDTTRCIGCRKCEEACNKVNELPVPEQPFDDLRTGLKYQLNMTLPDPLDTPINTLWAGDGTGVGAGGGYCPAIGSTNPLIQRFCCCASFNLSKPRPK